MKQKTVKTLTLALLMAFPGFASAQFNTIRKSSNDGFELLAKGKESIFITNNQTVDSVAEIIAGVDTLDNHTPVVNVSTEEKCTLRKKHLGFENKKRVESQCDNDYTMLPDLTISNLLSEIRRNGIRHEKIVLAQAILETGWFSSSVCRNKNNLFGLTNPRTGQYYEFNHWTESVSAYYSKVQYRYKGGNYLLWLKDIGYAEDPRYVSSLIRILRQYML